MDLYQLLLSSSASLSTDTTLSSSLMPPAHPFHLKTITTFSLPSESLHALQACSLHLLFQLPPSIFIDLYELEEQNDHHTYAVWGETDLEKPVSAVDSRGSALLVNVSSSGTDQDKAGGLQVQIPMHVRYLSPSTSTKAGERVGMYETVEWSWPLGFYVCPRDMGQISHKDVGRDPFASIPVPFVSPFDLTNTDIALIPPHPTSNSTAYRISVPTGDTTHLSLVQFGTTFTVLLSFLYVGVACWRAALALNKEQGDKTE